MLVRTGCQPIIVTLMSEEEFPKLVPKIVIWPPPVATAVALVMVGAIVENVSFFVSVRGMNCGNMSSRLRQDKKKKTLAGVITYVRKSKQK